MCGHGRFEKDKQPHEPRGLVLSRRPFRVLFGPRLPMVLPQALTATTQMPDAMAFIGWVDKQASVAKNRKVGTQGYCMGGPIAFRTAAAVSDRVGAVASFHGGGLVTEMPNSPHLQAAKTKAQLLIAIAANDDMQRPNEKNVLKEKIG